MASIKKDSEYQSAYSNVLNDLVNKAVNREAFSYDPATDQAYQAYAKQYTALGEQAGRDTLANVAMNTGGLASSYAVTASQQARDAYNQQLTNKIPELMQVAYSRYQDELNNNLSMISTIQGLEDSAYNKWSTDRAYNRSVLESDRDYDRSVYEYDQNLAYQQQRDAVADQQYRDQMDYQASRDQVADQQWQAELNYQKARDAVADQQWNAQMEEEKRQFDEQLQTTKDQYEFENMLAQWEAKGTATKEVADYFGVKVGTKTSDYSYKLATLALSEKELQESTRHNKASESISWANYNLSKQKSKDAEYEAQLKYQTANEASEKEMTEYKKYAQFMVGTSEENSAVDYIEKLFNDEQISYQQATNMLKDLGLVATNFK